MVALDGRQTALTSIAVLEYQRVQAVTASFIPVGSSKLGQTRFCRPTSGNPAAAPIPAADRVT
jgi:hypothetical protein